ncbi:uncharacterized protein EI90DRAFT_3053072, partial [Cantharellus anzutake]|uniref:uncharacterized protein n=1 Tax=Cantharellus anzutake TaxID=1750568 RepID=UPI001903F653
EWARMSATAGCACLVLRCATSIPNSKPEVIFLLMLTSRINPGAMWGHVGSARGDDPRSKLTKDVGDLFKRRWRGYKDPILPGLWVGSCTEGVTPRKKQSADIRGLDCVMFSGDTREMEEGTILANNCGISSCRKDVRQSHNKRKLRYMWSSVALRSEQDTEHIKRGLHISYISVQ